jgi:galacturonokinase
VAYLLALEEVNALRVSPERNILLDQYIENTYLGLRNGILDQSAILLAKPEQLTWIDCRTSDYRHLARPPGACPFGILIAFSGLRQALVTTDYNRRVAECTEAASTLLHAAGRLEEQSLLGHVSRAEYDQHRHRLRGAPARRAAHFFSEMDRVRKGMRVWSEGDLQEFGRLITASGESSISNYECGAPPLIALYELLVEADGVYGARFSGAGFRGCCLALVDPEKAEAAGRGVSEAYAARFPDLAQDARMMICRSGDRARWLE